MLCHTRFSRHWISLLSLIVLALPAWARAADEAELLATIQDPNASQFDRMYACKQLAVAGTEAAVPVLAALLDDDQFAHYARYGLEPIPSPKVDEALISALSTLKGPHLIGVIYSIANRGKPAAIGSLADKLTDPDDAVATAAAHAIARLGTPGAAAVLSEAMSPKFAAEGLVCGKTLAEQGYQDAAARLLIAVSQLDGAPKHVRQAAMLQAVDLLQGDGVDMLATALASPDRSDFKMALRAARLLSPADAAKAANEAIKNAGAEQVALLVTLLGDLGDPSGLPAVVKAASSENPAIRIAAIKALATLGTAEHVPMLMDAAIAKSADIAAAAQATLGELSADGVDEAVLAALNQPDWEAAAVRLVGHRRIDAAMPKLLEMVSKSPDADTITALGEILSLDKLNVLGALLESESSETREAARKAIHSVCYRQPDRGATARKLAEYLDSDNEQTIAFVMEELRVIGGEQALALVTQAARSDYDLLKDYATRALGEWLDTSAATILLDLIKTEGNTKYGIRAVRGYIRLARQFAMDEAQRVAMCRTVIESNARDVDKLLVLEVLERYPSLAMLELAVDAGKNEALKMDAARTAMIVAQAVGFKSEEVKSLLSQLGQQRMKIEILKAEYGAGSQWKDVTELLKRRVRGYPLIVLSSSRYNEAFGGDPAPRTPKQLKIQYKINGKAGEVTLNENATIVLPTP